MLKGLTDILHVLTDRDWLSIHQIQYLLESERGRRVTRETIYPEVWYLIDHGWITTIPDPANTTARLYKRTQDDRPIPEPFTLKDWLLGIWLLLNGWVMKWFGH